VTAGSWPACRVLQGAAPHAPAAHGPQRGRAQAQVLQAGLRLGPLRPLPCGAARRRRLIKRRKRRHGRQLVHRARAWPRGPHAARRCGRGCAPPRRPLHMRARMPVCGRRDADHARRHTHIRSACSGCRHRQLGAPGSKAARRARSPPARAARWRAARRQCSSLHGPPCPRARAARARPQIAAPGAPPRSSRQRARAPRPGRASRCTASQSRPARP